MSKRFYRKPKFGWRPPGIQHHRRHQPPAVRKSGQNIDGSSGGWAAAQGGILGKIAHFLFYRWRTKRRRQLRPPKLPKSYKIDIK